MSKNSIRATTTTTTTKQQTLQAVGVSITKQLKNIQSSTTAAQAQHPYACKKRYEISPPKPVFSVVIDNNTLEIVKHEGNINELFNGLP